MFYYFLQQTPHSKMPQTFRFSHPKNLNVQIFTRDLRFLHTFSYLIWEKFQIKFHPSYQNALNFREVF
jgi:hypothetical protein